MIKRPSAGTAPSCTMQKLQAVGWEGWQIGRCALELPTACPSLPSPNRFPLHADLFLTC